MKVQPAKFLTEGDRDRKAYDLARAYLLGLESPGVITDKVLQHYVSPPRLSTMADVFQRLLVSAQNRGMMPTVIGGAVGGLDKLGPVLYGFDPVQVIQRFTSADDLLKTIIHKCKPAGKVRIVPGGLWPLFARAVLSGARFMNQFASGPEFLAWVQTFDDDPRKRNALPLLLSEEIDGFGFALACDFLKELGFLNFAKPDVHVNAIVKGLKLSSETSNDYAVVKAVVRIAGHCNTTPYAVDKVFWLIGSGRFYDHPSIGRKGRLVTDRSGFIKTASRVLDGAA